MPKIKNVPDLLYDRLRAEHGRDHWLGGNLTKGSLTGGHRTGGHRTGGHRTGGQFADANRPIGNRTQGNMPAGQLPQEGSLTSGAPNQNITPGVRTPGSAAGGKRKSSQGARKGQSRPRKQRNKRRCPCRSGHRK